MRIPHTRDKRPLVFHTAVLVVIVLALGAAAFARYEKRAQGTSSEAVLAQCLSDKGVKFYGAYWCPHCTRQKKLFGDGVSKLPYVECSVPGNPQGQAQACKDADVQGYPTWVFPDGTRLSGEQSLETLAEKSGCPRESSATQQ